MKRLQFIMLFLIISIACHAQSRVVESDGSIYLPAESPEYRGKYSLQKTFSDRSKQTDKIQSSAGLNVVKSSATGAVRLGMGAPIQIPNFNTINNYNIVEASKSFVKSRPDLFKIGEADEIRFVSSAEALGKFHVLLRQYHEGLEVLLSKINMVISPDAKVISFTSDLFDNIAFNDGLAGDETIKAASAKGLIIDKDRVKIMVYPEYMILPIVTEGAVSFKKVKKTEISGAGMLYSAFVDVQTGEPVWRINKIMNNVKTKVMSDVRTRGLMPTVNLPVEDVYLNTQFEVAKTDTAGMTVMKDSAPVKATLAFQGKWASIFVNRNDDIYGTPEYDTTKINYILRPGSDTTIYLNDDNCNYALRNSYHYVNECHDYITGLDPNFKEMDYQTQVIINYGGDANGLADGTTIRLTGVNDDKFKVANAPIVVYHEYGHNINSKFFKWRGVKEGMLNRSCHEALADLQPGLMLDEPDPTKGIIEDPDLVPGMKRDLRNKCTYPDSVQSNPHMTGRILAGAVWDLKLAIGLKEVQKLTHFARYSLPDDTDIGMAFREWFLAFLVADDDDNNLSNGTPHVNEIVKAFNAHKIGEILLFEYHLKHDEIADNADYGANTKFDVDCIFKPIVTIGFGLKSLEMKMRIEPSTEFTTVQMNPKNDTCYSASISAPNNCALIKYYFEGIDSKYNSKKAYFRNYIQDYEYEILLGYSSKVLDKCESSNNWQLESSGDNCSSGKWSIIKPSDFNDSYYRILLPDETKSPVSGKYCFSTGEIVSEFDILFGALHGKTTLTTPEYDLSKFGKKYSARFYYAAFNEQNEAGNGDLFFRISTDGGANWKNIDTLKYETNIFERKTYILDKFAGLPESMKNVKFSFKAINNNTSCLTRFFIEDFELLANSAEVGVADEMPEKGLLSVFPNPVDEDCYIRFNPGMENYSLTLIDALGRELQTIQKGTGTGNYEEILWTPGKLSAGSYFIKMNSGNSPSILPIIKK